jgi:hypothetical protein
VFSRFFSGGGKPMIAPASACATDAPVPPAGEARILTGLGLALLLVGIVCRLVRYLVAPPLWCDEVFVSLNFVNGDFRRLAGPLQCSQIAPILFLWAEMAAYRLLGSSEWALRLVPLLAGLTALPLFWHLARTVLPSRAAMLATGTLAVSRWPMAMSNLVKPYSLDLLLSLALTTLAVHWLRQPERLRYLVALAVLAPLALFASYPAVLVAGAIGLLLLGEVGRRGWRVRLLFGAYIVLVAAAFLGSYRIGQAQLGPDGGAARAYYQECWRAGFMPTSSLGAMGRWLLSTHTGELMAYPAGDRNGASTLTLLLCLAGVCWCARHRRFLLAVCLLPFGLALVASAMRKYPYGVEPRLDQHLAPFICMLVGTGAAFLLELWVRTASARLRMTWAACLLLAACGVAVSFMGTSKPSYWEREALWSWKIAREVRGQAAGGDHVVVLEPQEMVLPPLRWQLLRLGDRVHWGGQTDGIRPDGTGDHLWLLSTRHGPGKCYAQGLTLEAGLESPLWAPYGGREPAPPIRGQLENCLERAGGTWSLVDHVAYTLQGSDCDTPPVRCDLFLCRPKGQSPTRPRYLFSSWPR